MRKTRPTTKDERDGWRSRVWCHGGRDDFGREQWHSVGGEDLERLLDDADEAERLREGVAGMLCTTCDGAGEHHSTLANGLVKCRWCYDGVTVTADAIRVLIPPEQADGDGEAE
jgi:hypothetical protein